MKNRLKHVARGVTVAGLMVLGLGMAEQAEAYKNPDTMKVYVTPSGLTYSVSIASPTGVVAGYDFGPVAVGATTISTQAIVVTNDGTVGEYFALAISNTAEDNWTPLSSGVPAQNEFLMMGHFVAHSAAQPADSTFSTAVDTMTASVSYGSGNFGQSALTPPSGANSRDLYLRLTMPASVTEGRQQSMTLTINGQSN